MKKLLLLMLFCAQAHAGYWECIHDGFLGCDTWRMHTPEGWIVHASQGGRPALTYVPDKNHEWKL